MADFEHVMIVLIVLLISTYLLLYFGKPFITKHFERKKKSIAVLDRVFIPKVGNASLLIICGTKYLVVSNANAIAISVVNEKIDFTYPQI